MNSRNTALPHRLTACLLGPLFLLVAVACQESPPEPIAGERVENAELGLALASVPVGFELTASDAEGIRLAGTTPETAGGSVSITAGPEETSGINLIAESQARIDHFADVGGTSFGSRELQGPIGTAFTVRGRRPTDTGEVEETCVYALHPIGNRLVTMVYEYPAGEDTEARIGQILEILGEVEGYAAAGSEASG